MGLSKPRAGRVTHPRDGSTVAAWLQMEGGICPGGCCRRVDFFPPTPRRVDSGVPSEVTPYTETDLQRTILHTEVRHQNKAAMGRGAERTLGVSAASASKQSGYEHRAAHRWHLRARRRCTLKGSCRPCLVLARTNRPEI